MNTPTPGDAEQLAALAAQRRRLERELELLEQQTRRAREQLRGAPAPPQQAIAAPPAAAPPAPPQQAIAAPPAAAPIARPVATSAPMATPRSNVESVVTPRKELSRKELPVKELPVKELSREELPREELPDGEPPAGPGLSIQRWLSSSPPWLVSTVFHGVLLIILALLSFALTEPTPQGVAIVATEVTETALEELNEVVMELEELEVPEVRPDAMAPDPGEIAFSDLSAEAALPTATAAVGDLALPNTTIGEVQKLFGKDGVGMADIGDGLKAAASFFGTKSTGNRFVFVVDNSNSMGRGKFETALNELVRSVDGMHPKQRFYVIFFSDSAYGLFHPNAVPGMVPATDENKQRLKAWLYTVEMCLRTEGLEALQTALRMNPDVIYILGDGSFTDKTGAMLTAPHNRRTVINTVGMEVNDRGERELKAIAAANKGTYRLVGASPQAIASARQNPIAKNNIRGPVWGLKLPAVKKK